MVLGKVGSLPLSGAVGSLIRKYYIELERPARNKYSSLLGLFVNYEEKIVVSTAPGTIHNTLLSHILRTGPIT